MSNQVEEHEAVLPDNFKPRFKWTWQLHQCFVDAVSQLGGAEKATPKSVMQIMGIPGITLYHLKSHLQKYRLVKNKDRKVGDKKEENIIPHSEENEIQPLLHNSKVMLQLQMDVRKKLQEQIEVQQKEPMVSQLDPGNLIPSLPVQRHLQLRIEAQEKYLQSVLKQAQEILASYSLNLLEVEATKSEISSYQANSSVSKQTPSAHCPSDSCLTSVDCFDSWSVESNGIEHTTEEIDLNT